MQAVCERCYGFLVHEHREKAEKAAAKRRPVEAKQQQLRQIEPKQPKGKRPQPMAKKARRQLQRQLTGLDSLLAFFRVAGVRVELVGGRRPWIDGAQTESLAHLPPPETLEWNRLTARGVFSSAIVAPAEASAPTTKVRRWAA